MTDDIWLCRAPAERGAGAEAEGETWGCISRCDPSPTAAPSVWVVLQEPQRQDHPGNAGRVCPRRRREGILASLRLTQEPGGSQGTQMAAESQRWMLWGKTHRSCSQWSKVLNPSLESPEQPKPIFLTVKWLAGGGPKNPQPFKTESGKIGPWKSHHCHHFTLTESLEKSPLHYSRNSRGSECESGKSLFPPETINVLWNTEWTSEAETTQASPLWAENREGKVGFRQQAPPCLQHTLWWVWQQALSGHHFTLSSEAA